MNSTLSGVLAFIAARKIAQSWRSSAVKVNRSWRMGRP
jgi:hypothetical protein